jgi:hypothetical protein
MTEPKNHVADGFAMDGYNNKLKPLTEGTIVKGGRNLSTKITERPAPPALLQPKIAPAPTVTAEPGIARKP